MGWFERHLNENGVLGRLPGWVFIDWANVDKRGEITALNAMLYKALNDAAQLAQVSGVTVDVERYNKLAEKLRASLNERMWDANRGVYVDCFVDSAQCRRVSQQSNAAMILFEVAPKERWEQISNYISDPKRTRIRQTILNGQVISGGSFNEDTDVVMAQPFFSFYVHRALAKVGASDKVIVRIKDHWGAMLDAGATTWWEEWVQRPSSSESHAWSGAPTFDLSTDVLGVRPLEPGFATFAIAPKPGNLSFARGVFPTVKGDIRVDWSKNVDGFNIGVTSPPKTMMELELPVDRSSKVRVNKVLVWNGSSSVKNSVGVNEATAGARSIQLKFDRSGEFKIEATAR